MITIVEKEKKDKTQFQQNLDYISIRSYVMRLDISYTKKIILKANYGKP